MSRKTVLAELVDPQTIPVSKKIQLQISSNSKKRSVSVIILAEMVLLPILHLSRKKCS